MLTSILGKFHGSSNYLFEVPVIQTFGNGLLDGQGQIYPTPPQCGGGIKYIATLDLTITI